MTCSATWKYVRANQYVQYIGIPRVITLCIQPLYNIHNSARKRRAASQKWHDNVYEHEPINDEKWAF